MLAPQATATSVWPRCLARSTQALAPAIASAPAGSRIERVSSNTSLMAAQMASLSTRIISSTSSRHRRKVSAPTCLTATPSANSPTCASLTRRPAASERVIASASTGSTPMILISRAQALHVRGDAGDQAAAADGDEDRVDRPAVLAQDLHADGALAGDHVRIVVGMHEGELFAPGDLQRMRVGLVVGVAVQHHAGAARRDRGDLDLRRGDRHDDGRAAAELLRRQRHALGVVAGRGGDHAALELRRRAGAPSCCRRRAA